MTLIRKLSILRPILPGFPPVLRSAPGSVYSRSAQGVKVINVKDDIVSSVAILEPEEDSEVVDISHNEVLDEGVFEDASDDEDIIDNDDEEVTDSDSKE